MFVRTAVSNCKIKQFVSFVEDYAERSAELFIFIWLKIYVFVLAVIFEEEYLIDLFVSASTPHPQNNYTTFAQFS